MKRELFVKICGMREAENIRDVEALGPSWMGFICWSSSPRCTATPPEVMPERAERVGVFVNPTVPFVVQQVQAFGFGRVQLHGHETPAFCRELRTALQTRIRRPVHLLKAFSVATVADLRETQAYAALCDHFLFDTKCASVGGSGRTFDWQLLQAYDGNTPFLLSGGIGPESLDDLRAFHHPRWAGIDLNSRFETAPGHKDVERLRRFLDALTESFIIRHS